MQVRVAGNGTTWSYPPMRFDKLGGWRRYLDQVAAAGFDGIEHLPPTAPVVDAALFGDELARRSLVLAGLGLYGALETPEGRESLEGQLEVASTFAHEYGADYLYVIDAMYANPMSGALQRPVELDAAGWRAMVENLAHLDERSRDRCGLALLLHPHQYTHVDTPEQIERFLADTDPDRISILFDVGHYTFRGGDPVDFFRRHHDRIETLHLKNVQRGLLPDHATSQFELVETGAFADLTSGDVDFEGLRDALDEHGYEGWATVEIERHPEMPGQPVELAREAVAYLRELGYGSR